MEDQYKTKEQLINELAELRRRMTESEKSEAERKRTEEAQRVSLEKYRVLLESFPLGITISDKSGKIIETNRQAEQLLGITREVHAQRRIDSKEWQIIRKDGTPMPADEYASTRALRENRLIENVEMGIVKDKGEITWISVTAAPIPLEGYGVAIAYGDITERKRAVEAVKQSEAKYKRLIETALDGYVMTDMQGKILDCNKAYLDMLGYAMKEIKELSYQDITPQKWHKMEGEIVEGQFIKRGYSDLYEKEYVRKDGTVIPISIRGRLIRDEKGKPVGMWGFVRDITERKRTEQALCASNDNLRRAEQIAHVGYWSRDVVLGEITWSDETYRIFGLDPHTKRIDLSDHVYPEDRQTVIRAIQDAVSDIRPYDLEYRVLRPDGTIRWVHSKGEISKNEDGQPLRMFGVVLDITERKQVEEKLRNSQEQFRALSARIQFAREEERTTIAREIHDELGQALTGLKMDLSWLEKKLPKKERLIEKTQSMLKLVDSTIQTVRKISTELRPGILDDLGLIAALEWQSKDFENRARIKCDLTSSLEEIELDKDRSTAVFRILQETLTNVVRHAKATQVKVDVEESEGNLLMKVSDNGLGIRKRDILNPKSLGLLGMRERILIFGGEVEITGEHGKGTTVTVKIPLIPEIRK